MNNTIRTPTFHVVKPQMGNIYACKVLKLINEEGGITRRSHPHIQLTTLRTTTMHYILHEISYMSKSLPVMPVIINFP